MKTKIVKTFDNFGSKVNIEWEGKGFYALQSYIVGPSTVFRTDAHKDRPDWQKSHKSGKYFSGRQSLAEAVRKGDVPRF